jgi:hypothetical protein
MPDTEHYPYVYINAGSARELHPGERQYLETEFTGGDGAAPYIKSSYSERNGWGKLTGYLKRSELPVGVRIGDAPAEDPSRPLSQEEMTALKEQAIVELRAKGWEVIENSDGSFTMKPPR